MTPFFKRFACLTGALCLSALLAGCGSEPAPTEPEIITLPTAHLDETTPETTDPSLLAEHLDQVMEAGEIYLLDHYPNLKSVNLTGSTCYSTILEYIQSHPNVEVTYAVDFGSGMVFNHDTSATLPAQGLDFDSLLENLQYLPELTSVSLPDLSLEGDQIAALMETYPNITFDYTVDLFGTSVSSEIDTLDLSAMTSQQVDQACAKLALLPGLTQVQLGGGVTMADVAKLQDANPAATFLYSFTIFGKTLSTTDEEVVFVKHAIGNEGEDTVRQALDILDNCKRFVLDACGMDSEVLAKIREDYREKTKVVWRIYFGVTSRYSYLTDAETIRAVYNVTNDTVGPLKYCEDAKYIDMGHNDYLTDLTFVANMPNLEVFIGSGSAVTALTGFENCKKLVWLELANCLKLKDISALSACENLNYLNLSNTKVTDYSPLENLPLKRFMCVRPKASAEDQELFRQIHNECVTTYRGNEYGKGWRYEDNGKTFNEYYKNVIREVFDLDRREALVKAGLK